MAASKAERNTLYIFQIEFDFGIYWHKQDPGRLPKRLR
jgi:hypothetical protein